MFSSCSFTRPYLCLLHQSTLHSSWHPHNKVLIFCLQPHPRVYHTGHPLVITPPVATMMDHITEETCPLCQRDLACSVDHKSRSMLELISPLCVDISTKYKLDKSRFPGLEEERRHGRFEPVLVLASDPRARRMTRAVRRLQQTNRKWVAGS